MLICKCAAEFSLRFLFTTLIKAYPWHFKNLTLFNLLYWSQLLTKGAYDQMSQDDFLQTGGLTNFRQGS